MTGIKWPTQIYAPQPDPVVMNPYLLAQLKEWIRDGEEQRLYWTGAWKSERKHVRGLDNNESCRIYQI